MALGKTVGELLAVLSSEELTEWAAFYQIEPFGEYREDLRAGIVASTLANIHAKKGHSFKPKDFMPVFQDAQAPKPAISGEQVVSFFRGLQQRGHA